MTLEGRKIYYEDRSGAELDDRCGQAYFWNRIFNGHGIVRIGEPLALAVGRATHEDIGSLGEMKDISPAGLQEAIDGILENIREEDKQNVSKMEILYRRLGWLAAWGLYMEPKIREVYDHVSVEAELILDRDPLWVGVTPDRVLRDRSSGKLVYKELKTTITANYKWLQSWAFMPQLHIGMAAIGEELEERVAHSQIVGLMKGYYDKDQKLRHPYVWG